MNMAAPMTICEMEAGVSNSVRPNNLAVMTTNKVVPKVMPKNTPSAFLLTIS